MGVVLGAAGVEGVPAATTANAPSTRAHPMINHALSLVMPPTIVARH